MGIGLVVHYVSICYDKSRNILLEILDYKCHSWNWYFARELKYFPCPLVKVLSQVSHFLWFEFPTFCVKFFEEWSSLRGVPNSFSEAKIFAHMPHSKTWQELTESNFSSGFMIFPFCKSKHEWIISVIVNIMRLLEMQFMAILEALTFDFVKFVQFIKVKIY